MTLLDLMKLAASEDEIEVDHDETLAAMLSKLQDKSRLEPILDPPKLQGQLREYQKRGKRFIEALEEFSDSARLGRGRSYAKL